MLNKSGVINISMEVLFVVVVGVTVYTLFGVLIFEPIILLLMYLAYAGLRHMVKNNVTISWKGFKDYVYK